MSEPRKRKRLKLALLVVCGLLLIGGVVARFERTALESSYYAYRLERAPEDQRQHWADQLVELGEPACPKLIACFHGDDPGLCQIARDSLEKLLATWGANDPRCNTLADLFFDQQSTFSPSGELAALELLPAILTNAKGAEVNARARTVVSTALSDKAPEVRYGAIAAAARGEMNLLSSVVPLLNDAEPRIRKAALLALCKENSPEHVAITSDELLKWLHDPSADVRETCEMILRSRNLRDIDIQLGKKLTHPNPAVRLDLLLELPEEENLDLAVWLKRLSADADSAVRAGALRVAAESGVDFADRMIEMTRQDPDETVRKIAAHYSKHRRTR
jgi:HEAT repeat protein